LGRPAPGVIEIGARFITIAPFFVAKRFCRDLNEGSTSIVFIYIYLFYMGYFLVYGTFGIALK
jgi:hypothetical protein